MDALSAASSPITGAVGIFGGTFDPVHHGHLIIAEAVIEALGLRRLLLMPARRSPFKPHRSGAPGEHRAHMLRLAVEGDRRIEVSDIELERPPPSYTIDTLRAVLAMYQQSAAAEDAMSELFVVLGADSVAGFPRWREAGAILELARLVVVGRPGHDLQAAVAEAAAALPGLVERMTMVNAPRIDISASEVRRRAARGRSIRYRVPRSVADYIATHGLYAVTDESSGADGYGLRGNAELAARAALSAVERPRLLLATTNPGKVHELRTLMAAFLPGVELVTPSDVGLALEVEETGTTLAANAVLKAREWARAAQLPALAEDSGLEVDALDGAPGVASARWVAGDDGRRVQALLARLSGVAKEARGARYRAVVAFALPGDPDVHTANGVVEGRIASQPRGESGFGYDPIFLVEDAGHEGRLTMAQLSEPEKNELSHRSRAVSGLVAVIGRRLKPT